MNKETILREFMQRVWNEKDFDRIPVFLAPAYTIHLDTSDPWEGKTLNHSEFRARLNYTFNSFPDISFEITDTISDGNFVASSWIMRGTNTGRIGDYPPTDKKIEARGVTIYHFKKGKICGHTQVYDRTSIMKQLGYLK